MLKRICRVAKINELVLINKNGEREPKWSVMKSHCARKSFINNMVHEYNANPLDVADWAGVSIQELHKSYLGANTRKMFKEFEELIERSQTTK